MEIFRQKVMKFLLKKSSERSIFSYSEVPKVKNIRFVGGDNDIDCKIAGIGSMKLKSEFVKKVS